MRWRLLAGNGRALAVSPVAFDSSDEAQAALGDVIARAAELQPQMSHPAGAPGWLWLAADGDGRLIAGADRPYARHGTCLASFMRFRSTVDELADRDVQELFGTVVP